jgi:hypothetical protein
MHGLLADTSQSGDPADGLLQLPWSPRTRVVEFAPDPQTIVPIAKDRAARHGEGLPFWLHVRHASRSEPLFRDTPKLSDVSQGNLGDCGLLASLAAIVYLGTGHAVKLMMCGDASGDNAYVRLHDMARTSHYFKVGKSTIAIRVPGAFHAGTGSGLWAAVLEKAMTVVSQYKQRGGFDNDWTLDVPGAGYHRLVAMQPRVALGALLGVETRCDKIHPMSPHLDEMSADVLRLRQILRGDGGTLDHAVKTQLFADPTHGNGLVLPRLLDLFYERVWRPWVTVTNPWGVWRRADPRAQQQEVQALGLWRGYQQGIKGGVYRQEDFERFLTGFADLPSNRAQWPLQTFARTGPLLPFLGITARQAVDCVCRWTRQQRILSGRRGSGHYSAVQVSLFDDIRQALHELRPVVLGTSLSVGAVTVGSGLNGENVYKGLVGPHGYAVLGCHLDPGTQLRFVRVYNPWGNYGRGYDFAPSAAYVPPPPGEIRRVAAGEPWVYPTDAGVFWLELADLTKHCDAVTWCLATPPVILEGRALGHRT